MTSAAAPSTPPCSGSAPARSGCSPPTGTTSSAAPTWTGRLLDMIMERLEDQLSPDELDDLAEDKGWLGALALEAEAAKKDLSASRTRDIQVATPRGRASVHSHPRRPGRCLRGPLQHHRRGHRAGAGSGAPRQQGHRRGDHGRRVEPDPRAVRPARGAARQGTPAGRARPRRRQGGRTARTPPGRFRAALRAHRGPPPLVARLKGASRGPLAGPGSSPGRAAGRRHHHRGQQRSGGGTELTWSTWSPPIAQLPVAKVENRFGTIVPNQDSVRIQVYEQAGPVLSAGGGAQPPGPGRRAHRARPLPAGSVIQAHS